MKPHTMDRLLKKLKNTSDYPLSNNHSRSPQPKSEIKNQSNQVIQEQVEKNNNQFHNQKSNIKQPSLVPPFEHEPELKKFDNYEMFKKKQGKTPKKKSYYESQSPQKKQTSQPQIKAIPSTSHGLVPPPNSNSKQDIINYLKQLSQKAQELQNMCFQAINILMNSKGDMDSQTMAELLQNLDGNSTILQLAKDELKQIKATTNSPTKSNSSSVQRLNKSIQSINEKSTDKQVEKKPLEQNKMIKNTTEQKSTKKEPQELKLSQPQNLITEVSKDKSPKKQNDHKAKQIENIIFQQQDSSEQQLFDQENKQNELNDQKKKRRTKGERVQKT